MYNSREDRVNNVKETQLVQSNAWKQWTKAALILAGAVGVYFASRVSGILSLTNLLRRTPDVIEDATAICAAETVQFDGGVIDCNTCDSWSRITGGLTPGIESSVIPTEDERYLVTWKTEDEYGMKSHYGVCVNADGTGGSKFRIKRYESGDVYSCFKETVGLESTNDKTEESEQSVPSFNR